MKHLFIVNPVAGKQKPEEKIKLIHESADRVPGGLSGGFEIYVTRAPMDAVEKIRSTAANGEELRVYACGGDGTLNECVNGAAGLKNVAVTHFPCGTGNDFIKMFGDDKSRFFDLSELASGEVRPIDLISCNGRYSINICSMGLDARVGTDVHKYSGLPLLGGPAGYVASLAVNFVKGVSQPMTVTTEGLTCGPKLNLVCICNGRFYGGGFNPTNDARPDDGLLDVLIVSGVNRPTLLRAITAYASGRYRDFPQYITFVRTTHVEVETPTPQVINQDGEAEFSTRAVFDVVPGGVNFLFPRNMAFFDGK
ncbi:MAG TPA: YegS/Rv2252/BmrU family lipid kinase [Candidatus Scatomorpha intestinavium]|uniref:YegS/Rv2252/BmrU family lipid kinase n=1 Tax=Candidatus Scatomorpha intestinavium TaxID=2840922 RepID=A0A9D0ZCS1_9FIRM|nr:YegS/Rv2252/BmrU family lipid kinase [Candidatus Scatomorpha intestinavium]